jgi:hypothetical protein
MVKEGAAEGSALGLAALFGFGLQTFEQKPSRIRSTTRTDAIAKAMQGDNERAQQLVRKWNEFRKALTPEEKRELKPLRMESIRRSARRQQKKQVEQES